MTARVLIADEDDGFLADAAAQIGTRGYELSWAERPAELPRRSAAEIPELLLLDLRLAVADDLALLKEIRACDAWRDTAIIVVAPDAPDGSLVQLLAHGMTDFVATRRDVDEIVARLDTQASARRELMRTREALRSAASALKRARDEAESRRKLVDILHEVAGDFSPEELFHVLVRRVALALSISHCSLILARTGDDTGVVATAFENPALNNLEIRLDRYPEIRAALANNEPVLIEDVGHSPLYATVRQEWAASGFTVPIHSVIALPFTLDARRSGVFFLRTLRGEAPLTRSDVEFAESVVRAAVGALKRSQAIESTRADRERLEVLALTDPLTQLLNRRALMERLGAEFDRSARYGLSLTALMFDLDHFKLVNDTYGHLVGDEVLRGVGTVLGRELRVVDLVARYGGEEFVVVLPETPLEGAVAFGDRVRMKIAERPLAGGDEGGWLTITVSCGVATFPGLNVRSPDELIAAADEALYRAKAQGRNRVCT